MTEDQTPGTEPDEVERRDYAALVNSFADTLDLRGGLAEAVDVARYTAMSSHIASLLNLEAGLRSALAEPAVPSTLQSQRGKEEYTQDWKTFLAHIDVWFDAERQRIEGALVKVQTGWEIAHRRLADAKVQVSRCEREAFAADRRGSHDLAIDYLKERQQAKAEVEEYENLLPQLESDLNELTEGWQVLESMYGKLRQKALALHLRQGSAEALSELKDGARTLQTADETLRDAQERVDNNATQARAGLQVARHTPYERADLENQLKELRERQRPDWP